MKSQLEESCLFLFNTLKKRLINLTHGLTKHREVMNWVLNGVSFYKLYGPNKIRLTKVIKLKGSLILVKQIKNSRNAYMLVRRIEQKFSPYIIGQKLLFNIPT